MTTLLPQDFHPVVLRWWASRFAEPTDAQLEGWSAIRRGEHTLIAAPTGSGKTLAAFLTAIDQLLREAKEQGGLPDEVRVIYVSPLKALSADIHKNLAEPRREIRALAPDVKITAAVRSGDTPQNERAAMLRTPPHILVTTPESLYLLLTAERSRAMLRTARVVIVDEIHAVVQSRRGAHLALSLERLDHVCGRPLQRIGLSATQKPIEEVARFLKDGAPCSIVDRGHQRRIDLAIEVPKSPLEAVMSGEVWQEIYERLIELIESHRTTLVMVNTRRLAERMAHRLSEQLGAAQVAAHHGSLAKEARLDAEMRLREGQLKVLVATASLELGIDIGHVDLVCQISSPHRIATLLQRVGRSGHTVRGVPKGRVFPLTRDDLIECAAMLRGVRDGELDRIAVPDAPLDVLAQQIVAETAAQEKWDEDGLLSLVRRAFPYRDLEPSDFKDVVEMLSRGYATRNGRRGALIHYDSIERQLRARKGSRMSAILNGGAIPEVFDYRVLLEPEGHFLGTLNEDFAIESLPGDVFQLGNTSWRILRIGNGVVRVADAEGQPPSMPFWLGEAPARGGDGGGHYPVARLVAFVRPPGGVPLPASQFGARNTGAGSPRLADFRDALALEHHARARGAAQPRRRARAEPAAAHVCRGPAAERLSRRRGLSRQPAGCARGAAAPAGPAGAARFARRGAGSARPCAPAAKAFLGRAEAAGQRHARALGPLPRDAKFAGLHLPRRRAARGTPRTRRVRAARHRGAQRRRSRRARPGGDPARARGSLAGGQHGRRALRRADGRRISSRRGNYAPMARAAGRARPPRGQARRALARRGAQRRCGRRAPGKPHGSSRPDRGKREFDAAEAGKARTNPARPLYPRNDRARMVRSPAARAHSSLHAEPAALRDRAGRSGRLHALPAALAACRGGRAAERRRRAGRDRRATRGLRAGGGGMGA